MLIEIMKNNAISALCVLNTNILLLLCISCGPFNAISALCMLNTNILLLLCISCGPFNLIGVMNETVLSFLHVVEHRGHGEMSIKACHDDNSQLVVLSACALEGLSSYEPQKY